MSEAGMRASFGMSLADKGAKRKLGFTLRHCPRLSSQSPGRPNVAQGSAKHRSEVIAVGRLVTASRQAFLL